MEWYPKIKDLGIPTPKTEIVEILDGYIKIYPENFKESISQYESEIFKKADKIGYPLFLRNDQTACKHWWKETCYVEDKDKLLWHIARLTEETSLLGMFGLPWEALVFREFIPLESYFTSFFREFPVSKERRYFIKDGKFQCRHDYWFDDVIEREREKPVNWQELLARINTYSKEDIELLDDYAVRVAQVMNGYWSVDFAKSEEGVWYLIDMALGKESFHYPDCSFLLSKQGEQ
jgi:hypothetical protein